MVRTSYTPAQVFDLIEEAIARRDEEWRSGVICELIAHDVAQLGEKIEPRNLDGMLEKSHANAFNGGVKHAHAILRDAVRDAVYACDLLDPVAKTGVWDKVAAPFNKPIDPPKPEREDDDE